MDALLGAKVVALLLGVKVVDVRTTTSLEHWIQEEENDIKLHSSTSGRV